MITGPFRLLPLLLLAAAPLLQAAETELRLGPDEFVGGVEVANVQVEHGATRLDDAVLHPYLQGRSFGIGLDAEAWLALGDDSRVDIDAGELTEVGVRLDYLFELEGSIQILPFYQYLGYIEIEADEDAHWMGLDLWYLTPLEGLEVGGNFAVDGGDEYGWYGAVGARQFYQNAPLDLAAWEMVNFGDHDYHRWTSGADQAGLTTLELGAEATVAMPWQDTWASLRMEAHIWLQDDDRDAVEESVEFVMAFGFEYRLP